MTSCAHRSSWSPLLGTRSGNPFNRVPVVGFPFVRGMPVPPFAGLRFGDGFSATPFAGLPFRPSFSVPPFMGLVFGGCLAVSL